MRRTAFLLAGLLVCTATAAPVPREPERKLGPEWVKEKDGQGHVRKVELTQRVSGNPIYSNWYTQLPLADFKRDLYMSEGLNYKGRTVAVRLSGVEDPPKREKDDTFKYGYPNNIALSVERTDGKGGKVVEHVVLLGKFSYGDGDGDGLFDMMSQDAESIHRYIFLAGPEGLQLIRVRDNRGGISRAVALLSDDAFLFEKGKWRPETHYDRWWAEGGASAVVRSAFLIGGAGMTRFVSPEAKHPERKLGPEWVKERNQYGKDDYVRQIEVTQLAQGRSSFIHTRLPLEDFKRDLYVSESLSDKGRTLAVRLSGEEDPPGRKEAEKPKYGYPNKVALEVERTEGKDGKAVRHTVQLGQVRYADLDGDGRFDTMADGRDEKAERGYIFFTNPAGELALVRVGGIDRNLQSNPVVVEANQARTEYVFQDGKWAKR